MPPSHHSPQRAAQLEDFVGPVAAERARLRAVADVVDYAEATGKGPFETLASVMLAVGVPELTARRMVAGLDIASAAACLARVATYPGREAPQLMPEQLARWEAGEEQVPPAWLSAFCGLYHVSPRQLGYRDHTPPEDTAPGD